MIPRTLLTLVRVQVVRTEETEELIVAQYLHYTGDDHLHIIEVTEEAKVT